MGRMRRRVRAEEDDVRIRMLLVFGGFYYRTIAKRVFGRNYSESDVAHVGKVAREWNMSSRDWRKGKSDEAKSYLDSVENKRAKLGRAIKAAANGTSTGLKLSIAS